ncbi:BREX-1 system phosphatase PglZ type A [Alkalibacterium iburiense]|uniref:BREX-1 system phosphatase PglZ type A n=1 Tax=Alkalibacterium iburiense TaxID=290589 RepID=A0ABN0X3J6_9LACT
MTSDVIKRIEEAFSAPLKDGERRKILYLYDEEETYLESITEWSKESGNCEVLKVTPSNYFHTNYVIEKELVNENLFLYFVMDRPALGDNPLIDVVLYSEELKVDAKSQLYLTLGIESDNKELIDLIDQYATFFRSKERLTRFTRLFHQTPFQNQETLEYSVLATLTKASSPNWMSVLIELFEEAAEDNSDKWEAIIKFGNEDRFWDLMDTLFGYGPSTSHSGFLSVEELMRQVFITYLCTELEEQSPKAFQSYLLPKNNAVVVFINQWMNKKNKEDSYAFVSTVVEDRIQLGDHIQHLASTDLARLETFKYFDYAFIEETIQAIRLQATDYERLSPLLSKRRNTFWYPHFRSVYHFLSWSIKLSHYMNQFDERFSQLTTAEEIWEDYANSTYHIDQAYRKLYTYWDQLSDAFKESASTLKDDMERLYTNRFLPSFTKKWDRYYANQLNSHSQKLQQSFFKEEVKPYVIQDRRIVVFISDGLRYEAGKELFLELTKETRFNGEMDWMQTELPSITSLGMANLLPHDSIQLLESGEVLVDGQSTKGLDNREALLKEKAHSESLAIHTERIHQMNMNELRETFSRKKVVYIYHNKVDAIGDNRPTEHEVISATKESISEIKQLMHRLTNELSISSFLVTADHGYLYTRSPIPTSAKVQLDSEMDAWIKNKRFILSETEKDASRGLSFTLSERLDRAGYVTVPRGLNRFALQGGGYQYVHGGHLPQEMMVPLLRIKTDRSKNEIPEVEVSLVSQTRVITNNVVWLNFLQLEAVSEQKKEKRLKLYFEDDQGRKISNEVVLIADSEMTSSDERVVTEKFVLLNEKYNPYETYYFVMENEYDDTDVQKEAFKIDLV